VLSNSYDAAWRRNRKNRNLCRDCNNPPEPGRVRCASCSFKHNERSRIDYKINSRGKVIELYGGQCTCCGQTNYKYLELDHVNNDGNLHRKDINRKSSYQYIAKYGSTYDLQVLCANCHRAKTSYGGCTFEDHVLKR
jgi:5-methylcytosine-specific restriction endonuclease McrA